MRLTVMLLLLFAPAPPPPLHGVQAALLSDRLTVVWTPPHGQVIATVQRIEPQTTLVCVVEGGVGQCRQRGSLDGLARVQPGDIVRIEVWDRTGAYYRSDAIVSDRLAWYFPWVE